MSPDRKRLVLVTIQDSLVMPMTDADPKCLRVFVVENDEDTLKYFRMYLEFSGHRVWEARTVAEAIEKIPAAECDVLISDVGLTDGTGWQLLQQLRDRGLPHPPFAIAMSGFGINADRLRRPLPDSVITCSNRLTSMTSTRRGGNSRGMSLPSGAERESGVAPLGRIPPR